MAMGVVCLGLAVPARAQDAPPPAYLSLVEGDATLERDGESERAVRDMLFVIGDRLRTDNGRVEIEFPDGSAIEVGEDSVVDCVSATRVRLAAGTMDHLTRHAADARSTSASYLPSGLQTYGSTFDRYGSWQYAAPYGYVWYPTVAPEWRPYYNGSWSAVPAYGWTWVGADAWSFPTHHYGRWGVHRDAWFWIPGRTWAAAWVSWGAATDFVGWCPLGWDNRPVFPLSIGDGRSWDGWTVLSRSHFGARGHHVNRDAYDSRRFDARTRFVEQSRAPVALPHQHGWQANDARRTTNAERRTPNAAPRTPNAERRTTNDGKRVPSSAAVPRRAYPIEAPRAAESPRVTTPGGAMSRDRRPPTDDRRPPTDDRRPTTDDGRPTTAEPPHARTAPPTAPRDGTARERGGGETDSGPATGRRRR